MSAIDLPREYADGEILLAADLDAFLDAIETFLNITKLNDENLQNGGITASLKLVNASVTNAKMAADSVDTTQIVNDAVNRDKIAANVAGTGLAQNVNGSLEITTSGVATAMIADSAVTTAKINDGAVTQAKRVALGQQTSSASASTNTTSTTYIDIPNLTLSITTTGRPVFVGFMTDPAASFDVGLSIGTTAPGSDLEANFKILRDATKVTECKITTGPNPSGSSFIAIPPGAVWTIDTPSAGTYTYKAQYQRVGSNGTINCDGIKLVAYEL